MAAAPLGRSTILPSSRNQRVCNDFAVRFVPSFSAFAAQFFGPSVLISWRNCASSDSDHGFGFGLLGSFTTRRFFLVLASWAGSVATGVGGTVTAYARLVDSNISLPALNALSQMLSSDSSCFVGLESRLDSSGVPVAHAANCCFRLRARSLWVLFTRRSSPPADCASVVPTADEVVESPSGLHIDTGTVVGVVVGVVSFLSFGRVWQGRPCASFGAHPRWTPFTVVLTRASGERPGAT